MPLLKNNAFIADAFVHIGAEDALPEGGNVCIPFSRLKNEWESLAKFPGQLGALLSNTDHAEDVAHFLPHLALVILPFPAFVDGRAYSIARQIRQLGYRGELRATGNVLPDQFQFMSQVGFNTFEFPSVFRLRSGSRLPSKCRSPISAGFSAALVKPKCGASATRTQSLIRRHGRNGPMPDNTIDNSVVERYAGLEGRDLITSILRIIPTIRPWFLPSEPSPLFCCTWFRKLIPICHHLSGYGQTVSGDAGLPRQADCRTWSHQCSLGEARFI
jgi:uncharacterized protein (DUF934 family)